MAKQNILITGASGYLGTSLVRHFLKNNNINKIIGTDVKKPLVDSNNFIFEKVDIRNKKKYIELLKKHKISQVFHLAFILGEVKDQEKAISVNVGGTKAIIEAANQVKTVKRITFSASVSAYGANKNNKLYIKEGHPLRANTLKYGINKRLTEEEVKKIRPSLRKDLEVVVLRICTIVGPTEREGGTVKTYLALPFGFSIIGHECPVQFVHEHDLLKVFDKILVKDHIDGVYNVAPNEYTNIKDVSKKLGRRVLYFPYSFLYVLFYLIFRLKPSLSMSEKSISYVTYPIVVDSSKIQRELKVKFKYSSLDAFLDCANNEMRN